MTDICHRKLPNSPDNIDSFFSDAIVFFCLFGFYLPNVISAVISINGTPEPLRPGGTP